MRPFATPHTVACAFESFMVAYGKRDELVARQALRDLASEALTLADRPKLFVLGAPALPVRRPA